MRRFTLLLFLVCVLTSAVVLGELRGRDYQKYLTGPSRQIPQGVLSRGETRDLSDEADWSNLLSKSTWSFLRDWRGQRVLLIGPQEKPISCEQHGIEPIDSRLVVHLFQPNPDSPDAIGGCAIVIGSSGGSITIKRYWK